MLTVELSKDIEHSLALLAQQTGRSKSALAQQAIEEMLRDYQDLEDAKAILAEGNERIPLSEVLKEFAHESKD